VLWEVDRLETRVYSLESQHQAESGGCTRGWSTLPFPPPSRHCAATAGTCTPAGGWTRSPRLHRPSFDTENAHTRGKRADQALIAACRIEGELGSSLNVRPTKTQHLSQSTVPRVARRHGSWPTTKVVLQLQRPPHQARARVIQQRHRLWWHRPNLPHDVGHGRGRSA
jgi:hypothetical protein